MHKSIVIFVLFSIIIAVVNAQCSCQTKPPIEGGACQCGCKNPPKADTPKITQYRDAHYDYGYKFQNPQEPSAAPSEVKYSFDFHVEKPHPPPPSASLATYGFQVDAPSPKPEEQPRRYAFEYQVQTPVTTPDVAPTNLEGLAFKVETPSQKSVQLELQPPKRYAFEYVVQTPNVQNRGTNCKCNCYKPTLDDLQSCPKHGHLYQCGGPLNPSNQQRYNQDPNLQMPDQQVTTLAYRSKRDVSNTFPIKIQIKDLLSGLRPNNQINKMLTAEQENQNRIDEIMKKNFGIVPEENIEDLVRPKPLNSLQSVQSMFNEDQDTELLDPIKLQAPAFIGKIKQKNQEIRDNMKSHISKIVNKARLETILNNHMIQKRSSPSENFELADVDIDDVDFEPMWLTESNDESHTLNQNSENLPENVDENDRPNSERIRKHCDRCGELARKYPCPSCGDIPLEYSQPQYFEIKQGNAVPIVPSNSRQLSDHSSQPRYVFDRYGHRYLEHDGKFKLIAPEQSGDDVAVGSYYNGPDAYSEVKGILDRNSDKIHMTNRRIGEGHILQPMNLAHATDAIRFISELTQTTNNEYNEDFYSAGDSYDVGSSHQNRPAKRSFQIIPVAEDKDDGSVLVRIAPTKPVKKPQKNGKKKYTSKSKGVTKAENFEDSEGNIFGEEKSKVKANFEKVIRDGKKYEILAFSENGSDEGNESSDESMEFVKYLYASNYNEPGEENPSTKGILAMK